MNLLSKLISKVVCSLQNDYSDNWCTGLFGPEKDDLNRKNFSKSTKSLNDKGYYHYEQINFSLKLIKDNLSSYINEMEKTYSLFEDELSKTLFIELLAYRMLGHRKVRLSFDTEMHKKYILMVEDFRDSKNFIPSNWEDRVLFLYKFQYLNESLRLYMPLGGPIQAFYLKQYHGHNDQNLDVKPNLGDIVLDCGGCWGDTTFEFAASVGSGGKVYVYEFIPFNNKIIRKNAELNPSLAKRVEIINHAAWSESGKDVYYFDNGPGSKVQFQPFDGMDGNAMTLSIDDLVSSKGLRTVDLIKMDIEGAEQQALVGATNTIKIFKPKLAISIYHSLSDFTSIAIWIDSLGLGYKFYIRHFTIYRGETVLFATTN
jgi:FkbM family methyltransferase